MVCTFLHRGFLSILCASWIAAPCAAASVLDKVLNSGNPAHAGAVGGGMCMPSVTAPPCAQGDAAAMASAEPSLNLGIGNPVHLATGAKHQFDVDLPASRAHPGLEIVRHYHSMRASDSPLGTGWRFSYESRIVVEQGVARIEQANGARVVFDRNSNPARDGVLRRTSEHPKSGWQWIWPNGRQLDFDGAGYLTHIRPRADPPDAQDPATEIVRHHGTFAPEIAYVRSGNASLHFVYTLAHGRPRLTAIDSPAGRFRYALQALPDAQIHAAPDSACAAGIDATTPATTPTSPSAGAQIASGAHATKASCAMRLTAVTRPDDMQRLYLYEAEYQSGNAHLPTGIVLAQPAGSGKHNDVHGARHVRIRAWDYDAAGRAIGVSYGERRPEDGYSRIRYRRIATAARNGITEVNSPAGRTRFTIALRAGQPRLLKVQGAGCPGCAAPGTQASYDDAGRLLSVNGTRITRSASGLPVAIEPQAPGWPGLRMTFSAAGARRQWQSALTGLETLQDHAASRSAVRQFANGDRMDVAYDDQGRPLRIRESRGADPSGGARQATRSRWQASGSRQTGEPPPAAREAITTTLHWRDGQLHCLQHPFATERRHHDAKGRLTHRTELRRLPALAGASTASVKADNAGLACDADAARTTKTAATTMAAMKTMPASRPAIRTTATSDSGATAQPPADANVWRITERFQYDDQDRLTAHVLPEGGILHYVWGEGAQLRAMTWEDASGARHPVITSVVNTAGYRYGNGLHLYAAHDQQDQMSLTLLDAAGARWRQTRVQNARGQVLREAFHLRPDASRPDPSRPDPSRPDPSRPDPSRPDPSRTIFPHMTPSHTDPATPPQQDPAWTTLEDWQYAYDAQGRLIGAQQADGSRLWLAWQANGALAAMTTTAADGIAPTRGTIEPAIARDASGLPAAFGDLTLKYGANRRLSAVQRQDGMLAAYVHNAYGQRIRAQIARTRKATTATDYLYLDNRRVAQTHPSPTGARPVIARRYLYAHHVPVGMIVYDPDNGRGALYAIHADLLGAPRMVTDAQAAVRWLAAYTPLGEASRIAGDLTLDLRLPGQWRDAETGLHDNLLRTYAPQWGQYLEPDPLGPVPGSQALGYADQQPRRFVDPLGLILLAFDGTRHGVGTNSNVMKFLEQYQDGPMYYHGGPGSPYTLTRDAITAFSAPRILETQWLNFLVALKQSNRSPWLRDTKTGAVPIDVVGFSRGAALARHFGNMIAAQTYHGRFSYHHATLGLVSACVDLRFMGLLDTVAQFGLNGIQNRDYDFSVAEVWRWVSHAVALHEYRTLFPLSSIHTSPNMHVTEAPFIGAHGDIGGGNLLDPKDASRRGDLANVALNWLWWQAQAAGVAIKPLQDEDQSVSDAVVNSPLYLNQGSLLSQADRGVLDAQGGLLHLHQRDAAHIGHIQRQTVKPLIHIGQQRDHQVGYMVDMNGYRAWLQQELGWNADGLL